MNAFETAFQHIIDVEGAYSNHSEDTPTKYGITRQTLGAYLGRQPTIDEVKRLTLVTASMIYRRFYWDELGLDQFPPKLAIAIFDQAVNRSPYNAALTLQTVLGVTQDGRIGPRTLAAVKARDERMLVWKYCRESLGSYVRIVQYAPAKSVFLAGWINRVMGLTEKLVF